MERASQLGLHAVQAGLSPIVVHPAIAAGAYGRDDVAEERERGLGAVLELVRVVALCGGALWVIERDQGGLSEGTAHELELYLAQGGQSVKRAGWPIWRAVIGGGAE